MDEYRRKKSSKNRIKRPSIRRPSGHGGPSGGSSLEPRPPPNTPRRDYNYKTEQKAQPKEEKSHWNGKVEVWTEPQKPRQEKIIKYEVDTDKLLNDLARENKETLNEITERLQEANTETNPEQSDAENPQKSDSPEKTVSSAEPEPNKDEPLEASEEKTEKTTEPEEAEPQPENGSYQQEASQEIEQEAENQENPLDAPELIYMSPSFWDKLESELSDELEQLEPQEELEIPPEEGEPINEEGY